MQPHAPLEVAAPTTADDVFGHVVVGIDETSESLVAAVQANVLRAPAGRLTLVAVAEEYLAAHAGLAAGDARAQLASGASDDLARAARLVGADESLLVSGRLVPLVCRECRRRDGTLIAVGARPHRRLAALTFGGHDAEVLRDADCSVLVSRPGWGPHPPDRILVAADGSPESGAAEDAARRVGARLGREVVAVVGLEGATDEAAERAGRDHALVAPGQLPDALGDAATRESLVVVGRASHAGSDIAERVAYATRCSVLVVRHEPARTA